MLILYMAAVEINAA